MKIIQILGGAASLVVIATAGVIYYSAAEEASAIYQTLDYDRIDHTAIIDQPAIQIQPELTADYLIANQPIEARVDPEVIEDINCLALNIYFEARNQSILAQEAVAWVTLNRMYHNHYPDTICAVVWDEKQFSWTHDGKSDDPKNQSAWQQSLSVANRIYRLHQERRDPTEGAIMFHAAYVSPYWRDSYEQVVRIDSHIFYKEK